MRLFFFGSMMDADMFAAVVGRPMDAFNAVPGVLHGYERHRVRGESYPVLAPHPGGRVEGVLVDGLTESEVDRIRFFEGGEYELRPMPVTDRDGAPAGAYACVSTGILEDAGEPWRLDAWTASDKPRALVQTEELMALYGKISTAEMDAAWLQIKERADRRYEAAVERRHQAAQARKAGRR